MMTAGIQFLQGKSVSKGLLALATPEKEAPEWHTVTEVAKTLEVSPDEVRQRLSAMNRSLLGYQIIVGDGEDTYDFSKLETFRIYSYKS